MIAGVVRDQSGVSVSGARVYFTDSPAPTPDVAALSGADGRFALGTPVEGTYTLECSAEGFAPTQVTVVSGGENATEVILRRE